MPYAVQSDASPSASGAISPAASVREYPTGLQHFEQDRHNERIVREMHIDHLHHVENELTFYEKVPLRFLLGARTPTDAKCTLQQLLVNYQAGEQLGTNQLSEWARTTSGTPIEWAPALIEALAIVRADTILRRFGFFMQPLRAQLLPHQPDSADGQVHPMLKWLVHLCEHLRPDETRQLIEGVRGSDEQCRQLRLPDLPGPFERYLELWLLLWLSERVICVGEFVPNATAAQVRLRRDHCDLDRLIRVLVKADSVHMQRMGEKLRSAQIRFNCTTEGVIRPSADKLSEKPTLEALGQLKISHPEDRYEVRSSNAGIALIINQETFGPDVALKRRDGTVHDRQQLERTFSGCGFVCDCRDNLTADEMRRSIEEVVQRTHASGSDALVVCVLSHGFRDHVFGVDGQAMSLDEIEQLMCSVRLTGKPKILIVQACQADRNGDQAGASHDELLSTDNDNSLPMAVQSGLLQNADFFRACSTIPGCFSYRYAPVGSWFIQSLCQKIQNHASNAHIYDILTMVINQVLRERGPNKEIMLPMVTSTQSKSLYLPQRTAPGNPM